MLLAVVFHWRKQSQAKNQGTRVFVSRAAAAVPVVVRVRQRLRSAASAVRVGAGRKSAAAPHLLLPLLPLLLQLLLSLAQLLQLLLNGRPVALARNAQRLRDETRKT